MLTPSVPVFCYHDISDQGGHAPNLFCEHLDAIRDAGFRTITAAHLLAIIRGTAKPEKNAVVLTFDDGHISNYLTAAPELERRGMTGVFFALSQFTRAAPAREPDAMPGCMSMPDAFRRALMEKRYDQFMTVGELKSLLAAGHEVYAHGRRHQACFRTPLFRVPMGHRKAHWAAWSIYDRFDPDLPTFTEGSAYVYDGFWPTGEANAQGEPTFSRHTEAERRELCRADFTQSHAFMRELNGADEQLFCWPWGAFDAVSERELRNAGFAGAFTLERGPNGPGTDPFRINRLGVGKHKTGKWVQQRIAMYRRAATAKIFFKKYRKKPETGHVLYATDSLKISGGSRQLVNNAQAMADLGVKVTVAVPSEAPLADALAPGVDVVRYDRFKQTFAAARFFKQLTRQRDIDVIHTFHNKTYKAAILGRLLGGGYKLFINRGVVFKPNALFGLWARIANGMIVNSFACARSLTRILVPLSRIQVVYNSFIPDGPAPTDRATRKKRGLRILYVGNEAPAKGLDTFLLACRALVDDGDVRDVEFVVVGVKKLARFDAVISPGLRERLTDLGPLSHEGVMEQMRWADMLVLSSRQESLPNILPEAFHAGLPVICTRAGGVPELVRDGHGGLLCEVEDHACLATKIRELMPDFTRRIAMGKVNQQVAATLLTNRRKGLELLKVYHGQAVQAPLPLQTVTAEPE